MTWAVRQGLRWKGQRVEAAFERALRDPHRAQVEFLRALLDRNRDTVFGKEHSFAKITDPADFAKRVPIRDYEALRPYIDRLEKGETRVLTDESPLMFATTSGTSNEPKLVPVTKRWLHELSQLTTLWLHRAQVDHPGVFAGKACTLVSPAVEDVSPGGTPIGSVSGLTYCRLPWLVRRSYVIPYEASEIANYDHRYFVVARLMLGADVSLLVAPNPSTLLRLASDGAKHGSEIARAVHDGTLGVTADNPEQQALYRSLEKRLRPDRARARRIESSIERHGAARPSAIWPDLSLIGCWLGGSAGVQAERLGDQYGKVPVRDLGFRATEATITVPFADGTASGPLALGQGFFEFIPEDSIKDPDPPALLAHELEDGARYYILLTTSAGLYRYDINDIVEVRGFHHRAPRLAFVRKGRDMVSLTGEKLHAAQVGEAAERTARALELESVQVQIIPDPEGMRYDLLVECCEGAERQEEKFAELFDENLRKINIEYKQKRDSKRLGHPNLVQMRTGWAKRRRQRDVEIRGKRDAQYKWPLIQMEWDESALREVKKGDPD